MSDLLDHKNTSDGLWLNMKELADRQGVTRQAMHKRIKKLVASGHLKTKKSGRSVLVNLAEYDFAVAKNGDAFAEQAAKTQSGQSQIGNEDLALRNAQRKKVQYDVELKKLQLDRELGKVRPVEEIENAGVSAASEILRVLEKLPSMADEITRAGGGTEFKKARVVAKRLVDEIRHKLVDALVELESSQTKMTARKLNDHKEDARPQV